MNKTILIFNCGSSSLSYKIFKTEDLNTLDILASGKAHRVGVKGSEPSFIEYHALGKSEKQIIPLSNHREAVTLILDYIQKIEISIDLIGHRIVHGGTYFKKPSLMTPENLTQLEACLPLAPLHNPSAMSAIIECQKRLPDVPNYCSFDTVFHASLPPWASTYPLPAEWVNQYSLRKFGFHGLSYHYITAEVAHYLNTSLEKITDDCLSPWDRWFQHYCDLSG